MAKKKATLQQSSNMNYAYSLKLTFNRQRVRKDGKAAVYMQLIFNRVRKSFHLGINWPPDKIDSEENILRSTKRNDKDCDDFNIIIRKEFSKINEIFRHARLAETELTMPIIEKEYENYASKEDFISFAKRRIKERVEEKLIRETTGRTHKSAIATLAEWKNPFSFSEINNRTVDSYKAFLIHSKGLDSDTAYTKVNIFRTYLNQARADGIIFFYPFAGQVKLPKTDDRIDFLEEAEVQTLIDWYGKTKLAEDHYIKQSVRGFLFICYTGIRIGDLYSLTHNNLQKDSLEFIMGKSDADHQIMISIPLHDFAKSLITTKKGKLFILPSEVNFRAALKKVAAELEIASKIGPHIGRHTFATRFLEAGGRVEVLQKLLGHTSIKTTMKYVHVTEDRKRKEINLLS